MLLSLVLISKRDRTSPVPNDRVRLHPIAGWIVRAMNSLPSRITGTGSDADRSHALVPGAEFSRHQLGAFANRQGVGAKKNTDGPLLPTRAACPTSYTQSMIPIRRNAMRSRNFCCHRDRRRSLRPITVSTYESVYRHMHRFGDRFRLLIVDEAHHLGPGSGTRRWRCRSRPCGSG